jgi:hypothetical protein
MDVNGRIVLEKAFDVRRQIMQTDAVNGRHADRPGDDVLDLLQLVMQAIVGLDDLFAEIVEDLAFPRQAEFLLAALDEQGLELSFQRTDLLAHGGLGDPIDLRGLGETLRFCQVTEDL